MKGEAIMELSCHCGHVVVQTAKRPEFINECNCSLCRKSGAIWAYFTPDEVRTSGETGRYSRSDKAQATVAVHFCMTCGSTTHFELTDEIISRDGNALIGVNMYLANPEELSGIELRYPDGRSWSGVGDFGYVKESIVIGSDVLSGGR